MIRDFIAIDFEMSQRALSQRAWHRVMGRSSPFASLYSTSAKLRPLTFTHAGSIFRMASIMSQRAWHRVT